MHRNSPLYRKLLLLVGTTGHEMSVSFQHLYEVPLLQALGVPVTVLSFYPIVTGPLALILLSLSGRLSDKGSRHRERKVASLVVFSAMMIFGIVLLIVANLMLLSNEEGIVVGGLKNLTEEAKNVLNDSFLRMSDKVNMSSDKIQINTTIYEEDTKIEISGSVPITAILGMVGIAMMDMGYDINVGIIRACVLACSNSNDHTVLLLLALVLAALGGCFTNVLGLLDLSQVFDLGASKGSLVAQTTAQLMICGLVMIISVTSTAVTALFNITNSDSFPYIPFEGDDTVTRQTHDYQSFAGEDRKKYKYKTHAGDTESSGSSGEFGAFIETDDKDKENNVSERLEDFTEFISESTLSSKAGTLHQDADINHSSATVDTSSQISLRALHVDRDTKSSDILNFQKWKCWRWTRQNLSFIGVLVSSYLGTACLFSYNMFVSNFLGNVVMGGDSTAPHDSAEFRAYSYGMTIGAGGLLIFYFCCLAINIVHNKVLDFWGLKVDFCLANALMAASILSLVLSKHVAAFYVCSVVFGFHRSVIYTVPYIIVNNYSQDQNKDGESATGKMMAIMTCTLPLANCTFFVISGPLITITQYAGAPLVLGLVCTALSSLLFLLMYRP